MWRDTVIPVPFADIPPEVLRARIAERIREIAERRGIPLTQVADRGKVSRTHMWDVLAGRSAPTSDFLAKLANVLRVEPMEFMRPPRKPRAPK
ncbi:MAG: helix-turn-helix transcriptional regulator [Nannocystaceae bacterium]